MSDYVGWTDERTAKLKELWAKGLSASVVAAHLGGGVTRNAVIGKVVRLKLPSRSRVYRSSAAKHLRRPGRNTNAPKLRKAKPMDAPKFSSTPLPEAAPPLKNTIPVALLDLEPHHCRWPFGESNYTFCGCRKMPGSSYCTEHHTIATRPIDVKPVRDPAPMRTSAPGLGQIDTVKDLLETA